MLAGMTITTIPFSLRKAGPYTATAGQTSFSFGFPVLRAEDLTVWRERAGVVAQLTLGAHYTVSGLGEPNGGAVVLTSGAVADDIIAINGDLPKERASSFVGGTPFTAAQIDSDLNRLAIMVQELGREISRAIRREAIDSQNGSLLLPRDVSQTTLLALNTAGELIPVLPVNLNLGAVTPFAASLLDDPDALTARSTLALGTEAVNVFDFIPIGLQAAISDYTSTTDVSAYIQAAQDSLASAETLRFPAGKFCIASTLIKRTASFWGGAGRGGTHGDGGGSSSNADYGTVFEWTGAAGGTMIDWSPFAGVSNPAIKGGGITGIALDGTDSAHKAAIGLSMKSVSHAVVDMFAKQCSTVAFDLGVVASLNEIRNVEHCEFRLSFNQVAAGDGIGVRFSGDTTANVCFNTFKEIYGLYKGSDGLSLGNSDNNLFWTVWVFRFGGGTGVGIRLKAAATAGEVARVNTFMQVLPGDGGVTAEGTETNTAATYANAIHAYDEDNAAPPAVIGTGATLFVRSTYEDFKTPFIATPQGRLTLTSGTPVLTAGVIAAANIFYTPYAGRSVPIYDGTRWRNWEFAELILGLNSNPAHIGYHQAGKNFDLFAINDAGTVRLAAGPAWSTDTARGTGAGTTELARLNGILTNAVSMTARFGSAAGNTVTVGVNRATYLGTFRASANGQSEQSFGAVAANGTAANLFLWNNYNRRPAAARIGDTTDNWTYATPTWRPANNSAAMRINFVVGIPEDLVEASFGSFINASGVAGSIGVGLDTTTAFTGRPAQINSNTGFAVAEYKGVPGLGLHFLSANEHSTGATTTFYGDSGSPTTLQNALLGIMQC
jgi:hypothetical protein